ncbi:MAG: PAS domain S-box protein [Anaerolineales bacterium]|nr:PAS domain S-box protein [Anaerolineales bacterium]
MGILTAVCSGAYQHPTCHRQKVALLTVTNGVVRMEALLKIFAHAGDACFAIDQEQSILSWNKAAETLSGITAEEAIGQPCWQILKGRTVAGRPFCGPNCPVFQALQQSRPLHAFDLLVAGPAQETLLTNISTLFVPADLSSSAVVIHLQRLSSALLPLV